MPRRPLPLELDTSAATPLFAQIATSLVDAVRSGRLAPGDPVPGSRSLAESLGVHRNTVLAAYDELISQGWLRTEPGRGTFVGASLPVVRPRPIGRTRARVPDRTGFALGQRSKKSAAQTPSWATRHLIQMGRGIPDVRLVPHELLARAYRRCLRRQSDLVLGYGDTRGHERLRVALVDLLNQSRGLGAGPDDMLVTRGSQMALDLVARTIVEAGDAVAVEALGYAPARLAFANAGASIVPVPVDAHGLDVDALARRLDHHDIRAVYLTPHHQYPTTAILSPGRRHALLALARKHRFAVVEDDYDHEIHYHGRPVLPLASIDSHGVVIYVGSLSKTLAPSLRIGYAVAPQPLIERMAVLRDAVDGGGDQALECAVAELIEDDELQKHVRRVRRVYRTRRDRLDELLQRHLADDLTYRVPAGGMALWARVATLDPQAWAARAEAAGVHVSPGRLFRVDGRPSPHMRLGFGACTEDELRRGVKALADSR